MIFFFRLLFPLFCCNYFVRTFSPPYLSFSFFFVTQRQNAKTKNKMSNSTVDTEKKKRLENYKKQDPKTRTGGSKRFLDQNRTGGSKSFLTVRDPSAPCLSLSLSTYFPLSTITFFSTSLSLAPTLSSSDLCS